MSFGPAASGEDELAPFENSRQKYRLQRPREWEQVNKAGADALFKATNAKSTDIGVTVNAIKIKRLEQLGDVKAAGERLLAAERKKVGNTLIDAVQPLWSCWQVENVCKADVHFSWCLVHRQLLSLCIILNCEAVRSTASRWQNMSEIG